ncbi:MAG: hypothetical protein E7680_05065 [Ruminococcaceae bacterium]|nr:hypothetical protein [Oscillospiraceae bacterium]
MRLDKMLSECGVASRSEVARACRKGLVLVNGTPAAKPDLQVDETSDSVISGLKWYDGTDVGVTLSIGAFETVADTTQTTVSVVFD